MCCPGYNQHATLPAGTVTSIFFWSFHSNYYFIRSLGKAISSQVRILFGNKQKAMWFI